MSSLTGKTLQDTYTSLLKLVNDTQSLVARGSDAVQIRTGDDEETPLFLNTDSLGINTNSPGCILDIVEETSPTIHLRTSGYSLVDGTEHGVLKFGNSAETYTSSIASVVDNGSFNDSSLEFITMKSGHLSRAMVLDRDRNCGINIPLDEPVNNLDVHASNNDDCTMGLHSEDTQDSKVIWGNDSKPNLWTMGIKNDHASGDWAFSITNNEVERICISPHGTGNRIGLLTTDPTAQLDINSDILRLRTSKTPASATATGNAGDICWDASYIYICVATNTWKRTAIDTW